MSVSMFTRGIRFEVAQDVLSTVMAHWSEMASQGQEAADPDAAHLADIQVEQRKSRVLRDELNPAD